MLGTLTALALAATTGQADDSLIEQARSECSGMPASSTLVDARGLTTLEQLVEKAKPHRGSMHIVVGGDFSGQDLREVAWFLDRGCIVETKLEKSDLRGADLVSTVFIRAQMAGADLRGATLDTAQFVGVDLSGADLSGASLGGATWEGANWSSKLEGTSFRGAFMESFAFKCEITMDMSCGGSSGADFSGADLTDADLSSYPIWGFDSFDGATFNRTYVSARAVPYLEGIDVIGPVLLGYKPQSPDDGRARVELSAEEFGALVTSSRAAKRDVPSFDCAKAAKSVETLICGEYQSELRRLDRDMAALYGQARTAGKADAAGQRAWLSRRNDCTKGECVETSYRARMQELFAAIGTELAIAPDASREYEEDVLPVTDDMRQSALYQRILPAIRMASMQGVTLTGREDGSISARGEAVGGNAHTCSLGADELVYDPATGWYSATARDGSPIPILLVWDQRLFFRYSGNADTPDEAQDYISCGMRAAFGELRELGR
ncbi:pentapeptide repeat-containing protein [Parerythrobacter aestuarii]|uniref:pentapeptide repeat-containing protein n=1 Tax=Parerythrobacter aestuarii TaxID=3020909 RepID=UPI0024DEED18|nr:pentapeptide repeat-containing protein [Parerythrobacter aestuarii]